MIAERLLGNGENLLGALQAELAGKKPHVFLVFADPVGKHLERQQDPRRGCEAPESWKVENGRRVRILTGKKSLDGVVQPPGRQVSFGGDHGCCFIDSALRLEDRIDVAGCPPLVEGEGNRRPPDHVHLGADVPSLQLGGKVRQRSDDLVAIHPQTRCSERSGTNTPRRRKAAGAWAIATARKPGTSLTNQNRSRNLSGSTDQGGRSIRWTTARCSARAPRYASQRRSPVGSGRSAMASLRDPSPPRSANSSRNSRTA